MKKLLSILLALAMVFSLAGCKNNNGGGGEEPVEKTYAEISYEVYMANLGEFYEAYMKAKEAATVSEKYALMAQSEAKLMEAAVMLPLYTRGGNYGISRVVPYTTDFALWGVSDERIETALVATEFIKAEDRQVLRDKYNELQGTGTYNAWAKSYLEGKGYTFKNTYDIGYTSEPQTWDALATSKEADTEMIIQCLDLLMRYDSEGMQQPALAESYEVSEDGSVYTFHLREGVKWVDMQGREVADVTADDFVAGMQHALDSQGGLEYLVQGVIVNADEYIQGEVTDFSQVGVKALDDYTLEYTLTGEFTYFPTMVTYNIFAPMNRAYYESLGGTFGLDNYTAGTYGTSPETILANGPYLVSSLVSENSVVFSKNEAYYNKDNMTIDTYTWKYNDGTDVTKAYNDAVAGTIDGCSLNPSTMVTARTDGLFDDYAFVARTQATTFMSFYNLNRAAFANVNDGAVASPQDEEVAARTNAAMNNVHFRRAISMAYSRADSQAQRNGEELKYNALRNSYTPYNFVVLEEEVTVDVNGTPVTYPAGTLYGKIMQDQIDADGVKIVVYDEKQDNGGDGFDGWYNVDNAVEELELAIAELKEQGIEISAENPIYVDLPTFETSEVFANMANAYKQSVENALGGRVIMNLTGCQTDDEWYYAGYYTDYGYEANYDIYDLSGWGPDYGDPSTYLDTMLPEGAGYMVKCLGIY